MRSAVAAMYSHRDHRAFRDSYRMLGVVVVTTGALVAVAAVLTVAWAGLLCLVGLALLGTLSLAQSRRLVDGYARDLAAVRAGRAGSLRAEVQSSVALDHSRRGGGSSPNVRRRPVGERGPAESEER